MRPQRGFTVITFLLLLGLGAGIFWALTYGQAYMDNFEVKAILNEAANLAYQEPVDKNVHSFVYRKLHEKFDIEVQQPGGKMGKELLFDAPEENLRIERSKVPARIDLWFFYSRDVRQPFTGTIKTVTFNHHAEQDLSPTKW